jgi:hypothetical protein
MSKSTPPVIANPNTAHDRDSVYRAAAVSNRRGQQVVRFIDYTLKTME